MSLKKTPKKAQPTKLISMHLCLINTLGNELFRWASVFNNFCCKCFSRPQQKLNEWKKHLKRWRLKTCLLSCFKSITSYHKLCVTQASTQWSTAVQTRYSNWIFLLSLSHFSALWKVQGRESMMIFTVYFHCS